MFFFVANTARSVIVAAAMLVACAVSFNIALVSAVTLPKDLAFQRRFVMFNTALVAAWTTAAACLSVLVAVTKNQPDFNLRLVSLVLLGCVVLVLGIPMALWSTSVAYCLVYVWALSAAALNPLNEENEEYLWAGTGLFAVLALLNFGRWIKREFIPCSPAD